MYAKPTSPQSIAQVLDGSLRLTAAAFPKVWIYAVLLALGSSLPGIYELYAGIDALAQARAGNVDRTWAGLQVLGIVLTVFFFAAIYLRAAAVAEGRADESTLVRALVRLPLLLVMVILYAILLGLPVFVVIGLFSGIAIVAGIALAVVAVCFLLVIFNPSAAVFLLERQGPVASLSSAARMVWGHWWRTALVLLVAGILMFVLYLILAFVFGVLVGLGGFEDDTSTLVTIVVAAIAVSAVIYPFTVAVSLVIYWDLKLRREGGDLAARMQVA